MNYNSAIKKDLDSKYENLNTQFIIDKFDSTINELLNTEYKKYVNSIIKDVQKNKYKSKYLKGGNEKKVLNDLIITSSKLHISEILNSLIFLVIAEIIHENYKTEIINDNIKQNLRRAKNTFNNKNILETTSDLIVFIFKMLETERRKKDLKIDNPGEKDLFKEAEKIINNKGYRKLTQKMALTRANDLIQLYKTEQLNSYDFMKELINRFKQYKLRKQKKTQKKGYSNN